MESILLRIRHLAGDARMDVIRARIVKGLGLGREG